MKTKHKAKIRQCNCVEHCIVIVYEGDEYHAKNRDLYDKLKEE